jgi:hypothetical protein
VIKNFVLDHVDDATGQKLLPPVRPDVLPDQAARDQVWETMTGSFHAEGNPSGPNLVTSLVSKVSSVIPHGNGAAPGSAKPGPTNAAPPH